MKPFYTWRKKHFLQVNDYTWKPKTASTDQLIRDELAKLAIAIKLEDTSAGVPPPLHAAHPFEWNEAHRKRILAFNREGLVRLPDGSERIAHTEGSQLAIARQLSSGFVYAHDDGGKAHVLSTARMDALEEVIDQVDGPVLVAIYYRAEAAALLQRFGARARAFVGDTPASERVELIDAWNCDEIDILVAAPSAMGHGINLQHGSSRAVVWYSHTFNWGQRAQFNARLVRSGQRKTISIIDLVGDVGIDRAVLNALANKQEAERAVLDAMDINHRVGARRAHVAA